MFCNSKREGTLGQQIEGDSAGKVPDSADLLSLNDKRSLTPTLTTSNNFIQFSQITDK